MLLQSAEKSLIVGYFSKSLTDTQQKYNIYTKELLAIVKSVEFFKQMLHGKQFKVVTDNSALSYFKSSKQTLDKYTRWLLFLEDFDIVIENVKCTSNLCADALTRLIPRKRSNSKGVNVIELKGEEVEATLSRLHKDQGNHIGFNTLKQAIKQEYVFSNMNNRINSFLENCKVCRLINATNKRNGSTTWTLLCYCD